MFSRLPSDQPIGFLIGSALLAIGLGIGLGLILVLLGDPVIATLGFFAALAALVMTFNVRLGLLALIFISLTRFSDILINHGWPSIAKPFIALLAIGIVVRWLFYNQPPRSWGRAALLVAAYGVVVYLSLLYADNYASASAAASDFLKDGIIAVIIVILLQDHAMFRRAIWAILVAGIFLGTLSVFQYLTGSYSNDFGGFSQASVMNIVGQSNDYRISGPYGSPNVYAQIMVVCVPLALERLMSARSRLPRLIALWALVVCSLTVVFTFSRSGFLALSAVLALYVLWKRPRFGTWVTLCFMLVFIVSLLPQEYLDRLSTLTTLIQDPNATRRDVSFRGRTSEGMVGVMMFLDNPIIGVGVNNYPSRYQDYSRRLGIDPRAGSRSPHSLYIEVAAEQGIIGILVFGLLVYSVFAGLLHARQIFNQLRAYEMKEMATAMFIAFAGYMTSSLFVHGSYPRPFWMLVGISLAFPAYAQSLLESRRLQSDGTTYQDG